jgi:succinate dehydrogenase / fumarate reductase cytochrome b subunit
MSNNSFKLASITRKITMALAGLFLVIFLIVHLVINLLMLLPDDGKLFLEAAHFMGSNIFIKIFEVVLFGAFILHAIFGVMVWVQNRMARPVRYHSAMKSETSLFSKWMIHTGVVILIFLVMHLAHFYFVKLGLTNPIPGELVPADKHDFYTMSINLFTRPWYSAVYIVLLILLGFHLNHSVQSAFQSMGWNHPKYTPCIKTASSIYSLVIAVGFIIIPLYFLFIH